jgi:ABC-type uncharacterized transport system ATPase subunit
VLLHVLVDHESEQKEIETALAAQGIIPRIERVLPSLEDVFIWLVEDQQQAETSVELA